MANNSFKIKNSLVLTPKDLATLISPEAGDLACDINDSNKIKRYDAASASWVEVGSGGGVGGVDIFFVQDFESASLSSFTQTGLVLSQTDPLKGKVSAVLTHQAAINQSFKQVIPVDRKFRGQTMVLRLDAKSSASAGNLVIKITNETASTDLVASEQLEISNDVNGAKSSVSFTIPESCASLSYTITALPQSGSPVSRIDDIICELASTALLETAVEVPVVTGWQGYTPTFQGFGSPSAIEFEWRQVGENVEIRGKFVTGSTTAVEARVGLPAGLTSAGTSLIPSLQIAGQYGIGANSTVHGGFMLTEPSVAYVTFGQVQAFSGGTGQALTKQNASGIAQVVNETISLTVSIPCAGLSATTTKTIPLTQSGLVQEADSIVRLSGGSFSGGYMVFTTLVENQGDAFSVNPATGIVTVLKNGTYTISASADHTSGTTGVFIHINNAPYSGYSLGTTSGIRIPQTISANLKVNDTIRISNPSVGSVSAGTLVVTYQGSLKQVSVITNQKATIPTSELRFEGSSSRGSTATAIVRFDTQARLRGDAFSVVSDATNGTAITMLKAGKLDVNVTLLLSDVNGVLTITRNQQTLTSVPISSEVLVRGQAYTATAAVNGSISTFVNIGDVIRVAASAAPTSNASNQLNLAFQEQSVQVSVSNTLPQFSESDLVVRTGGNAGQAITANVTNIPFITISDTTGGAWTGSTFVVPESGTYEIATSMYFTAAAARNVDLYVDGVRYRAIGEFANQPTHKGFLTDAFSAGQVLSIRSTGAGTLLSSITAADHYLNITKVGKPNVTGVDVTPFVNVPQPESQSSSLTPSSNFSGTFTGTLNKSNGQGIYSYNSSTGLYTVLKRATFSLVCGVRNTAAANIGARIVVDSTVVTQDYTPANTAGLEATSSYVEILQPGQTFSFVADGTSAGGSSRAFVIATALSDSILTAPETFSTDTASLQYASSSLYNLTTLASAPVGTYITFTYAANTNTRTQTTTRPTQTDADMNANGIQVFSRAYNAASTSGNPSAIAVQIGKGLKGLNLGLYKSAGKVTGGALDIFFDSTRRVGITFRDYNESTGILYLDAAYDRTASSIIAEFNFSDLSIQNSGYLVINASKNPALTGLGLNTVAARAINTSGAAIANATNVTLTYDANKTFDTLGALNASTGVFTCPSGQSGYYRVTSAVGLNNFGGNAGEALILEIRKNGSVVTSSDFRSVTTFTFQPIQHQVSDIVYLNAGDTLLINVYQNSGTALSLVSSAGYVYTAINKVGV